MRIKILVHTARKHEETSEDSGRQRLFGVSIVMPLVIHMGKANRLEYYVLVCYCIKLTVQMIAWFFVGKVESIRNRCVKPRGATLG